MENVLHAIQTATIYILRSKKGMKWYLYTINNVKMLILQKSEKAISVEQNVYTHVCVSQPHFNVSYCILMDKVITQLLGFLKLYFN